MNEETAMLTLSGTAEPEAEVGYHVENIEFDGGEYQEVRLNFDLGGLQMSLGFHIDQAEDLLGSLRDAIVHAKRARLEWETETDPDSGIAGESGD